MSTDLERRLREALLQDAERARLVNPNEPRAVQLRPMSDDQHPHRSAPKLVAAAAVVVVLALLVGALARRGDQTVDTTPLDTQPPVLPGRTLARGEDVEFVGNEGFAAQTLSIEVEERNGEVTGVFSVSGIVVVRVECADTDTDGVVIVGGTVTEGSPDHVGDVGDLLSLTIREGDPDRVNIGYDPSWGSCAELLETLPHTHGDFNESDFVAVEAGSDIETGTGG
jgi:hypothetical protein